MAGTTSIPTVQPINTAAKKMVPRNRDPYESACHTVICTPELLEMILIEVPCRDILLSQRVCVYWRRLVSQSIWLQRLLFMLPMNCGTVSWLDWRFDDKKMYTTIELGEPLRARRESGALRYAAHWGQTRYDHGKFKVFINPMLAKRFPILSTDMVKAGPIYAMGNGMEYAKASWKRMLITQPPINTMFLEWDHDTDIPRGHRERGWSVIPMHRVSGNAGVTSVDLVDNMPRQATGFVWVEGSECWQKFEGYDSLLELKIKEDAEGVLTHRQSLLDAADTDGERDDESDT